MEGHRDGCALIGMPAQKRRADDSADERDEANRLREQQQREKHRFRDLAIIGEWLVTVANIRADVYEKSALRVSTDTMRIGNRLDDGAVMAVELDEVLQVISAEQVSLIRGEPYDLNQIRVRVRRLRDEIADGATLAKLDRMLPHMRSDVPSDARLLAAYRADPIQKIAEILHIAYTTERIWMYNKLLRIGDLRYLVDGTFFDRTAYVFGQDRANRFGRGQMVVAIDPLGMWAKDVTPAESARESGRPPFATQDSVLAHLSAPSKKYRFVGIPTIAMTLVSYGTSILGAYTPLVPDTWTAAFFTFSIDPATNTISMRTRFDLPMRQGKQNRSFAFDSHGNIWCGDAAIGLIVYDPSGVEIAKRTDITAMSLCTADDGVWALCLDPDDDSAFLANYRLVPTEVYNRGLVEETP